MFWAAEIIISTKKITLIDYCNDSICNDPKLVYWVRTLKAQTIKFVERGLKD